MRFTREARQVLLNAHAEAEDRKLTSISVEILLLGLLRDDRSRACWTLESVGVPLTRLAAHVASLVGEETKTQADGIQLSPRARRVLDLAYSEAREGNSATVGSEHILLALVGEGRFMADCLRAFFDLEYKDVRQAVVRLATQTAASPVPTSAAIPERTDGSTEESDAETAALHNRYRWRPVDQLCALLLAQEDSPASKLLQAVGVSPWRLVPTIHESLGRTPGSLQEEPRQSQIEEIFELGRQLARAFGQEMGPEHLLLAVMHDERSATAKAVRASGITYFDLYRALKERGAA
jgi:ATP-dependent Clp protease ATP-binding subunit ClpA